MPGPRLISRILALSLTFLLAVPLASGSEGLLLYRTRQAATFKATAVAEIEFFVQGAEPFTEVALRLQIGLPPAGGPSPAGEFVEVGRADAAGRFHARVPRDVFATGEGHLLTVQALSSKDGEVLLSNPVIVSDVPSLYLLVQRSGQSVGSSSSRQGRGVERMNLRQMPPGGRAVTRILRFNPYSRELDSVGASNDLYMPSFTVGGPAQSLIFDAGRGQTQLRCFDVLAGEERRSAALPDEHLIDLEAIGDGSMLLALTAESQPDGTTLLRIKLVDAGALEWVGELSILQTRSPVIQAELLSDGTGERFFVADRGSGGGQIFECRLAGREVHAGERIYPSPELFGEQVRGVEVEGRYLIALLHSEDGPRTRLSVIDLVERTRRIEPIQSSAEPLDFQVVRDGDLVRVLVLLDQGLLYVYTMQDRADAEVLRSVVRIIGARQIAVTDDSRHAYVLRSSAVGHGSRVDRIDLVRPGLVQPLPLSLSPLADHLVTLKDRDRQWLFVVDPLDATGQRDALQVYEVDPETGEVGQAEPDVHADLAGRVRRVEVH